MNSFYITCTLAVLQRKRLNLDLSFEKADSTKTGSAYAQSRENVQKSKY
jgi:hypothetical protein